MKFRMNGRLVLAIALGLPSLVLFLISMAGGGFAEPVLSAVCHRETYRCIRLPWGITGLCARCTAFWFGLGMGVTALYRHRLRLPFWSGLLAMLPLITDGLLQSHTAYQSSNPLRVLTGLAAGLGVAVVFFGKNPRTGAGP